MYRFGQDFNIYYTHEEDYPPNTDNPTIYIYNSKPSIVDAKAGTGADITISAWTAHPTKDRTYTIAVTAIDDPDPNSTLFKEEYFLYINYRLQDTEQIQTDSFPIIIKRVKGQIATPDVDVEDIRNIYPTIANLISNDQLETFINIATAQTKIDFEKKGFEWQRILNTDKLHLAIAYRAISLAAYSESNESNDKYYQRFLDFKTMYDEHLEGLDIKADKDQDGSIDVQGTPFTNTLYVKR